MPMALRRSALALTTPLTTVQRGGAKMSRGCAWARAYDPVSPVSPFSRMDRGDFRFTHHPTTTGEYCCPDAGEDRLNSVALTLLSLGVLFPTTTTDIALYTLPPVTFVTLFEIPLSTSSLLITECKTESSSLDVRD